MVIFIKLFTQILIITVMEFIGMDNSSYGNKQITIKEVAKMAGVSVFTAARVVSNYGSVSEKTRKKVMKIVEQENYIPN